MKLSMTEDFELHISTIGLEVYQFARHKSVILGKQCLHVLSKGTALHKAVSC